MKAKETTTIKTAVTHDALGRDEYRVRLDVPVNDSLTMEKGQGLETALAYRCYLLL